MTPTAKDILRRYEELKKQEQEYYDVLLSKFIEPFLECLNVKLKEKRDEKQTPSRRS